MDFLSVDFTHAYNSEASESLRLIERAISESSATFTSQFYDALVRSEPIAALLGQFSDEEFKQLKERQATYLVMVLAPNLTMLVHQEVANRVGRTHALVGVDIQWLIEALALYLHGIHVLLDELDLTPVQRIAILRVVELRIFFDLKEQVSEYGVINRALTATTTQIDQFVMSAANLPDLIHGVFDAMGKLDGDVSGFFARSDREGKLQIEASFGMADIYQQAMEAGRVPRVSIDPQIPEGQGPGGRAWREARIIVSNSPLDPDRAPWRAIALELGFRSSCAIPLIDESGGTIALLSLYSAWPGFYATNRMTKFLNHIAQVLSNAVIQRINAPVIPINDRLEYRRLLAGRELEFHYQPIINLKDGSLRKIEALARLRGQDHDLILPDQFLPAFGENELLALFELGIEQVCIDSHELEVQGLHTRIAINIPAQALVDERYQQALFATLESHALSPTRITLEILETQEATTDFARHHRVLQRLRSAGIEIEQDDLGSGHSSLVRMDQYPFDAVKIDQGFVRGVLRNPQRALEFILYLTRLAHALSIPVTVEGLEHAGIIEAAAILGADCGQGYGIARPMPVGELVAWHQTYRYVVEPHAPRTALGALAGYLMWDLQLAEITRWPNLVHEFAKANSIVEHFVAASDLEGTDLDALLQRSHVIARQGANNEAYQQTRAQIIDTLSEYCLASF